MVTPEMAERMMLAKLTGAVQEQRYEKGPAMYQQEKADQADSVQPDSDSAPVSRHLERTQQQTALWQALL
jgi:hypothetical protein